ncbi:hypothetical protein GL50803_006685 [Giardia duodenalis]|uniref:Uncharacterized protein n=1 Tax=Giardia intestinalis (strain ATCC 50803 / WB clone C6) TaxID=184922 RepID=A8BSP2_GIAIC|nr:hypothetical protein GL50803_006685 [Giardia intestinalis]KAE8305517.1 hypothetical protein GL50803_006685 [Giardia intestinalis]|eukprot:XP_001705040.1 Hypothetical protein GL50803_6685 [Giardia lamblia ATCC 50803]
MRSFEHNPLDAPFSKLLYLSDTCEPSALLRPHELLKRPLPELYMPFFRVALTSCPVFAHAAGDYYFVVGFSRSHAFMFDLRTLFLQEVASLEMISEIPLHALPLHYVRSENLIEAHRGSSNGETAVVASLDLPSDTVLIESVLLESMLITFFVRKFQPSRLVISIKRTITPSNTVCSQFAIELASSPVYATASMHHFVAIDRTGTLILGSISSLFAHWNGVDDRGKEVTIPLANLHVKHTWTDAADQALLSGDIPTCCAVSSELGIVVMSTTSGKICLYDVGLCPIPIHPESALLDLKRLLSITPVVFRILLLAGHLVIIFERALPLFIRLSEHLNQHTLFLHHILSANPNHALAFTVQNADSFILAARELANRLETRKPKDIPLRFQDDSLDILVGIWKDTIGSNALSIFTDGLPDILEQQIVTLGQALLSSLEHIRDAAAVEPTLLDNNSLKLSVPLLRATEWIAKLLIKVDRLECAVQLGLCIYKSTYKELADLGVTILHNTYYQCMKMNYVDLGLAISHALDYRILEARPYAEHLWEKNAQNSPLLREAEGSKVYLLMERLSKGSLAEVATDIKELGIENLFSIDDIHAMLETMDDDLLFADQNLSIQKTQ